MKSLFDDQDAPIGAVPGSPGEGKPENTREPLEELAPLAERMRPRSLDEVAGQSELVGENGFLRRAISNDRVPSLIFWGPPGCGKTTLARLMAAQTKRHFLPFSAVTAGIKEIKNVMAEAQRLRRAGGRAPLLFVDEIHRFNRAQQDAFLPFVEAGDIVLVGATTENPSFELNGALLSRCRVVVLAQLDENDLTEVLERALADSERGLGQTGIQANAEALAQISVLASGDARKALNLLELLVLDAQQEQRKSLEPADVERAAQKKILLYDKSGEEHFNLISALHKSLRESDPDAATYWLLRMLESGEDPNYVARRLLRFASEDVGLADPQALSHTLAAWNAYQRLGSPEGDLALVQAAIYLALAPKSIAAYRAEKAARKAIREQPAQPVPLAIRNAATDLMKRVGYGRGHIYAPDTEEGVSGMECLPDAVAGQIFFDPAGKGFEKELRRRLEILAERRKAARNRDS